MLNGGKAADPRVAMLLRMRNPDEPDAAEVAAIEARRRAVHDAKAAKPVKGNSGDHVLTREELRDAVGRADQCESRKEKDAVPEAVGLSVKAGGKACATCGGSTHPSNGRCYKCRPGGGAGKPRLARPAPTAPEAPLPQPPRTAPAPADPEIAAMGAVLSALSVLDREASGRVLDYVALRLRHAAKAGPC